MCQTSKSRVGDLCHCVAKKVVFKKGACSWAIIFLAKAKEQETLQRTWEVLPSFYFLGSHFSDFQHVPIPASASFLV